MEATGRIRIGLACMARWHAIRAISANNKPAFRRLANHESVLYNMGAMTSRLGLWGVDYSNDHTGTIRG